MTASRNFYVRASLWVLAVPALCGSLLACHGSPAEPREAPLANGRWTGDGACLAVTDADCNLTVGCGHGQFPRPMVRADGTFDAEGTYRIEVGPISQNPAPPAHFSGVRQGSILILRVVPTAPSLPPASFSMRPGSPGTCLVPCV